jgi:hypothetical protein
MMNRRTVLAFFLIAAACSRTPEGVDARATWTGYWEGKGTSRSTPMNDAVRKMTRDSDFEFWFVVDRDGRAAGEIDLKYDSVLTVENLPSLNVGVASFAPKVGGKVTDLNPKRRFPLVGFTDGQKIALEIATPEDQRPTIEFTMRADPGVSGSMGGVSMGGGGVGSVEVMKIPMKPFSPFAGTAPMTKRPGGPFVAEYADRGENYAVEWSARQAGGEQRDYRLTPEMETALRQLRERLGM